LQWRGKEFQNLTPGTDDAWDGESVPAGNGDVSVEAGDNQEILGGARELTVDDKDYKRFLEALGTKGRCRRGTS
jgi:hypothetical protein